MKNEPRGRPGKGRLASIRAGEGERLFVLLHGFAATKETWRPVLAQLEGLSDGRVVAFDLPGHGGSLGHPAAERTARMADAVIAEIDALTDRPVHLAGHSMGGAVACLVALKRPDRVGSLALLAPGGFGPAIAAAALRSLAAASTRAAISDSLAVMRGDRQAPAEAVDAAMADRSRPGVAASHSRIAESFLRGDEQGVLPLAAVAASCAHIHLLWGRRDRIVPVAQAMGLPRPFCVTILEHAGHSLLDEAPQAAARLIIESAGNGAVSRPSAAGAW